MEYVGRRVKKGSHGHDSNFGLVEAFEPETGVFKIVYDNGDFEGLELAEVSSIMLATEPPPPSSFGNPVRKRGRPKKRCRIVNKGTDNTGSEIESGVGGDMLAREVGSGDFDSNPDKGLDLNVGTLNAIVRDDHGVNGPGSGGNLCGLDLNEGANLELNEKLRLDNGVVDNSGERKEIIDLNLDASENCEKLTDGREVHCFDLNLQFSEDEVMNLEEWEMQNGANDRIRQSSVDLSDHDIGENLMKADGENHLVNGDNKEDRPMRNFDSGFDNENVATQKKRRGRKRKDASTDSNMEVTTVEPQKGKIKTELDSVVGTPFKTRGDYENGVLGNVTRGRRGSKREVSDYVVALPSPAAGLRRSSRRAKMEALYDSDQVSNAAEIDDIDKRLSSPASGFMSQEKKIENSGWESPCPDILPPKLELPQSSCCLDIGDVPLVDLISVYAFLRSFSTMLFLSPFELDDFVVSVKCNDSTLLFDSIHVSLLRTLRKHLELLSNEGSMSATDCLRSLSWDFLDLVTWPMFVVEYLLLHSPGYIPGLDRCHLKILLNDYYKLPISTKVEILQHLCDEIMEVESFRTELNRRTSAAEYHTDLARDAKYESSCKRKPAMDVASMSCVTEEDLGEPADWNSDECCLCKMDGSLICCDGCPAAFHSRCVGVVSSLLPEGDWYCPECAIEKDKPWMKVGMSIRGAELLGSDLYGRIFYSSFGYLLVLESCNEKCSFRCYNRNDLPAIIESLESAPLVYDSILSAICNHWNVVRGDGGVKHGFGSRSYSVQSTFPEKGNMENINKEQSESLNKIESFAENRSDEKSMMSAGITGISNSSNPEFDNAENEIATLEIANNGLKMENHVASSEGSNEVSQTFTKTDTLKENGPSDFSTKGPESLNDCCITGKLVDGGDHHMTLTSVNVEKEKNIGLENNCYASGSNTRVFSPVNRRTNYINCYELARTAASFYEEFTCKSSDKTSEAPLKTVEAIIAGQAKVVSNRFAEFSWSNIKNSDVKFRKEKCGWCFFCRFPEDDKDCLFIMNDVIPAVECLTRELLGVHSGKNRKNHLLDIMCHIICLEDHLRGLLVGPWLNPNYSMVWRKSVLAVVDMSSLKKLLLKLESNLHHLAISADWRKHVDSVVTMGSSSHIVRLSSKHGTGRKKAKSSAAGTAPSSNAATGLSLFWWRGGRGSRMLFSWKVLPHTLVSKAARQGGGKKIPGILYPETGEYAKRIKSASWRAAVETSTSVEQLALQIRELDANIRWNDIANSSLISKIGPDTKKHRSFKKAIIRGKCSEESVVRYLVDFGKRKFLPDVVVKHGTMLEDSSNERKRYWLEESHVPLHMLKSFEEKKAARKSNKLDFGKFHESTGIMKKPVKKNGFEYLFSRAERIEIYQCGHCEKDVHVREAVSCQHCEGFFHKRHVQKWVGSTISSCTYTCHKCEDSQSVKIYAMKGNYQSAKLENVSKRQKLLCSRKGKRMLKVKRKVKSINPKEVPLIVPLRRSARNAERVAKLSLQRTKKKKWKKRKQSLSGEGSYKKPKLSGCKKKRAPVNSSYWLKGLQLSRRPNDERLIHFRNRMLLVLPGEVTSDLEKPKCSLCGELEHQSDVCYVACEICGVWLHFDALNAGEIENVIGFKCHLCLHKLPPLCPHLCPIENNKDELIISEEKRDTECTGENSNYFRNLI